MSPCLVRFLDISLSAGRLFCHVGGVFVRSSSACLTMFEALAARDVPVNVGMLLKIPE